jgi:hypothetical protein
MNDDQAGASLAQFLQMPDVVDRRPVRDAYVYVARSMSKKTDLTKLPGELEEYIGVRAFLVKADNRGDCEGKLQFDQLDFVEDGTFDEHGNYDPSEVFEENGVELELIARHRGFDGLGQYHYEPLERLIVYLRLQREGPHWIDPYSHDEIIRVGDEDITWDPHDAFVSVRLAELKDYLAARQRGLLVARYADRKLITPVQLPNAEEAFASRAVQDGRASWIIEPDFRAAGSFLYFFRLWQSFWIDPASEASRFRRRPTREFNDGVEVTLHDGEVGTFGPDDSKYFEVISLNPAVVPSFLAGRNNRLDWHCLTNFSFDFAKGSDLEACINGEGQIQAFFGRVAKLSVEQQRTIAAFSEPMKAPPSREFIRVYIDGQFLETRTWQWTLSNAITRLNELWSANAGEPIFAQPREEQIPDLLGPVPDDIEELCDVALRLQRELLTDTPLATIKAAIDLSADADTPGNYLNMKSIGYITLALKRFSPEQAEPPRV